MTSQLNVDAIVDKAGSGGTNVKIGNTSTYVSDGGNVTQNLVQGLAKCVYTYLQASNTLENSTNVSSITDTSAGVFTCTYSSAFSSDTANSVVSAIDAGAGNRFSMCVTRTASNHGGRGFNGTSATDLQHGFAVFGDLA